MDNLNLTPTQQERLDERDAFLKMDLPEIVDEIAWLDAVCYFIDDQYSGAWREVREAPAISG
jgi:hypothetical protein